VSKDGWFRCTRWTPEASREFEVRLARARKSSRAQYVRIQGVTLVEHGAEKDGRVLFHRVLDEWPEDEFQVVGALEHLADSYAKAGELGKSERYYRELLELRPPSSRGSGTSGVASLSLAEVLLRRGGEYRVKEAFLLLADPGLQGALFFDVQRFRHASASARACAMLGLKEDSAQWAKSALDIVALSAGREQLPRHPGIGKANPSRSELKALRKLAAT
jgi:hypothetical protein